MNSGLELVLDVGLMDITTCKPLANTMVEVWSGECHLSWPEICLRLFEKIQPTLLVNTEPSFEALHPPVLVALPNFR